MRLIIAGSRDFADYELLKERLDGILKNTTEDIEIVSGMCNGADKLGERYAKEKGYPTKYFPADWVSHGKKAGYLRNKEMAEYSTHCVCFWDGYSAGTKMMIKLAEEKGLKTRVIIKFNQ